jgi:hypothetical protein
VYLQIRCITASKCISKLARVRPPSASLSSFNLGFQVHPFVQLDIGLQVHLQTYLTTASKYISKFTRSRPPSASLRSLNCRLQVLLRLHLSPVCSQIGRKYIYRDLDRYNIPDYDVTNLVTVTKTKMVDKMPCGYGTLRNHCGEKYGTKSLADLRTGLSCSKI